MGFLFSGTVSNDLPWATRHACAPCLRRSGFAQAGEALQRADTDTVTVLIGERIPEEMKGEGG